MVDAEEGIIAGYITYRDSLRPTTAKTKRKQLDFCRAVVRALEENGSSLGRCQVPDLIAAARWGNRYARNTRITYVGTLKTLSQYIDENHHPIPDLHTRFLKRVKGGNPVQSPRKAALTKDEWQRILDLPLNNMRRAQLAVAYDGYLRPGELFVLKWSDFHEAPGGMEYTIQFKTEKPRTIAMREEAVAVLEDWQRESGMEWDGDDPVFPSRDGGRCKTNAQQKRLFQYLKEKTGIQKLMPSTIRPTAITHDVDDGCSTAYICLRAWGEPYSKMINLYARPDSAKIQRDQQARVPAVSMQGPERRFTRRDAVRDELDSLKRRMALIEVMQKPGQGNG